ncbi:sugar porter family MFS transporter, partial [Klebsiella pneumoniae]|nr:sugar porter family MFS transporter [Klebsiella pneumoniae]
IIAYERVFGQPNAKGVYGFTADRLAMLNSLPLLTYAIGVIGASFLGERWGRRVVFWGMNAICLVGIALCYAGRTYAVALVGRMIV